MNFTASQPDETRLLRHASRLWGMQVQYSDTNKKTISASHETLLKMLRALSGEKVESRADLERLIFLARQQRVARLIDEVIVAWDGELRSVKLIIDESLLNEPIHYSVLQVSGSCAQPKSLRSWKFENKKFHLLRLDFHSLNLDPLPSGYHKLRIQIGERMDEALLISAKTKVGVPLKGKGEKSWGGFLPLYGVRSQEDWGIGGLSEMENVQEFLHQVGGDFFGTLPLLASDIRDQDSDPSPYSPVSRLFWNEIYLSLPRLIEHSGSQRALKVINDPHFLEEIKRLKALKTVDYEGVHRLKKKVLTILAEEFFAQGKNNESDFKEFLLEVPDVESYAKFRAEKENEPNRSEPDQHKKIKQYHLYVQFEMNREMKRLFERSERGEIARLYLDFPVGVSRNGFDSHKSYYGDRFLTEASAGAPPDMFFSAGQDWGFAPLHPIKIRANGYDYLAKCLRHHMKYASVLRVDHMMAFHRIYAIPHGSKAKDGTYIRYRSEELYAVLSVEAEREHVRIVGEDLGTVPDAVRNALKRHDCLRMWVLPFETGDSPRESTNEAPRESLACLNTHDMPPFSGHWKMRDLKILDELGLLDHEKDLKMLEERKEQLKKWIDDLEIKPSSDDQTRYEMFSRLTQLMAESDPELLLITLEDLWGEEEPQNVPGTWKEVPNWRRKIRPDISSWMNDPSIRTFLQSITDIRRKKRLGRNAKSKTRTHAQNIKDQHESDKHEPL